MVKVVACLSASGMLIYKGCDYSNLQIVQIEPLRMGGGGGGGWKTIPTAEDTYITENEILTLVFCMKWQ